MAGETVLAIDDREDNLNALERLGIDMELFMKWYNVIMLMGQSYNAMSGRARTITPKVAEVLKQYYDQRSKK